MDYYILNDDHSFSPIPYERYYELMQLDPVKYSISKHIRETIYNGIRVSTIFMALNHAHGSEEPVLFESMVFYDNPSPEQASFQYYDQFQTRYYTYNQAVDGHIKICEQMNFPEYVIDSIEPPDYINSIDDLY